MSDIKSNKEITKFIGDNILELRSITKGISDNNKTLNMLKVECDKISNKILSESEYLDEDGNRILNSKYSYFIEDIKFKEFLKLRIVEFLKSEIIMIVHPELNLDDYSKCITWKIESVVIGLEKELLDKMSCVLGFGSNDVLNLSKRKEAIEIITGLIKTWRGY